MARQPHHHFTRVLTVTAVSALLSVLAATPVLAQELGQQCTNPDAGYTVGFPSAWYVNERVEGGDLADVSACRFFSPQNFDVRPQSEIAGVAIVISIGNQGPPGALTPNTEVGGKPAFITEAETSEGGFEPAGTRHYDYWIELGPDSWLVAGTSDGPNFVGEYAENKDILDAMMDSMRFGPDRVPDAAAAPSDPIGLVGIGLLLIAASLVLGIRRVRHSTA